MISLTGNKKAFTFVEIMVTITILATGIVMIYKTFLISLDQQSYLTHRLYANNLLDQKIVELGILFQEKGEAALQKGSFKDMMIHNKKIPFEIKTAFESVVNLPDLLQVNMGVYWSEHGRPVRLTRSIYISRY